MDVRYVLHVWFLSPCWSMYTACEWRRMCYVCPLYALLYVARRTLKVLDEYSSKDVMHMHMHIGLAFPYARLGKVRSGMCTSDHATWNQWEWNKGPA